MSDRCFVDTSILIYAYDREAGAKHVKAGKVVEDLWERRAGVVSVQVLQEFYVNVTRKIPKPLSRAQARDVVETYATWPLAVNDVASLVRASDIEERHGLSFWDSLILAAAVELGADRLLSEDFQHGRRLEGLIVENPLRGR